MAEWQKTVLGSTIPEGGYAKAELDDLDVLVFKLDSAFYALEDRCTHDDAELDGGAIEDGCIKCPRHGACFDIKTGDAKTAPAYEATDAFETRLDDNGVVEVLID